MAKRERVVRTPYNYDVDQASVASALCCEEGSSLTQQQFREECDINTLIERFGLGYSMPENFRMPTYGDFSGINDYHDACNLIAEAGEQFDSLPAAIRARFNNRPHELMDFLDQESNREEAVKLGLVAAPPAPPVVPVVIPPHQGSPVPDPGLSSPRPAVAAPSAPSS